MSSLCSPPVPFLGAVTNRAVRPSTQICFDPQSIDLSHAEVSEEERTQLAQLFYEFRDRISSHTYDLGSYDESEIVIKTTTDIPPNRHRPPRVPLKFQKELDEHINKLLKAGRIVESDTPWVHNTVLVKKKDGSLRVCLDFRPLNEVTIPDHYPLPRIDDILAKIAGHKYYTTLDLASGYMQLLLSPESQVKYGWVTHRGIYQFVYLPFGLKNAGAYFSRAMSRILAGLEENCLAYLDDIVVFDKDFPSHLESLRKQSAFGFTAEIESYAYRAFCDNKRPPILSRHHLRVANRKVQFKDEDPESDDIVEFPVSVNVVQPAVCSVRPSLLCLGHLRAIRPYDALLEQKQDPFCSTILSLIETQRFPDSVDEAQKPFLLSVAENCSIQKNGCLYYCERRSPQSPMRFERLVIPEKLKEPVFLAFHSSPSAGGHFNWRKTLAKISRKYFWPHMSEDIFALCRSCDECQRKRNQQMNREQLTPVISGAVFDKVYVDLTGPLHTSEDELGRLLRISRYFTTPYHHEGNGACERVFATFHPMLRTYIAENQLDWDKYATESTIAHLLDGTYQDEDVGGVPLNTDDLVQSTVDPTTREGRRPVLYQVGSVLLPGNAGQPPRPRVRHHPFEEDHAEGDGRVA
ncbi:reverse transcriptase [Teladorsagia circumcincta]|uniref:RNA-directed DNA polymerase n=1 Tax=Teladorsagia circumcincta TaxID=45464 RepID=A0A2G9TJH9_TELCI|nr:reverse transcriptase [Teladorsagia circumcincta]